MLSVIARTGLPQSSVRSRLAEYRRRPLELRKHTRSPPTAIRHMTPCGQPRKRSNFARYVGASKIIEFAEHTGPILVYPSNSTVHTNAN